MDTAIKSTVAVGGAAASFLFGGWTALLSVLVAFVVLDYLTGISAAGYEGKTGAGPGLNSTVGLWSIPRKVSIFAVVAVAHLVDSTMGDSHLFRDAAIFFYLSNELLSIIENLGRLGVPIPPGIQKAVEVLKGKGGKDDAKS